MGTSHRATITYLGVVDSGVIPFFVEHVALRILRINGEPLPIKVGQELLDGTLKDRVFESCSGGNQVFQLSIQVGDVYGPLREQEERARASQVCYQSCRNCD